MILSLFIFYLLSIEQSQSVEYFTGCNCALLPSVCTANCCCDPSCSTTDLKAFGCSTSVNTDNQNKQWCVPYNSLTLSNTPYIVFVMGNLICVDIDNSQNMNYYQTPQVNAASSAQTILQQLLAEQESSFTKEPLLSTLDLNSNKNIFDSSDLIWLLFSTNVLGYLTLPNQIGSDCLAGGPLNLYVSKESTCLQTPTSIQAQCTSTTTVSPLSISYYLGSFAIIQKPSSLNTCLKNTQNPATPFDYYTTCLTSTTTTYLIPITAYKCTFEDGTVISNCQTQLPSTGGTTTCSNLVKSVTYILRYDSTVGGVIEAAIEAVFFNYASYATSSVNVKQTFRIVYIPSSVQIADYDTLSTTVLSGNPGYLVGKPIQAGVKQTSSISSVYLTYPKAGSDGTCPTDDSTRLNVNFGINTLSECFYSYASLNPSSTTFCTSLQTSIYNIILGFTTDQRPTLFAPFANSKTTDFQSILNSIPNTQPTSSSAVGGLCSSIINGVDIIIAFANVGNVDNPQAELVYISYSYSSSVTVNARCYNQACSNLNQKIKVSTRVTFVDVSQSPRLTESVIPRPQVTLPGDFFFPLSSSAHKTLFSFTSLIIFCFNAVYFSF